MNKHVVAALAAVLVGFSSVAAYAEEAGVPPAAPAVAATPAAKAPAHKAKKHSKKATKKKGTTKSHKKSHKNCKKCAQHRVHSNGNQITEDLNKQELAATTK